MAPPEAAPDKVGVPRVVVAGTGSGVGKTSVACGIILGLTEMGYSVQPFKAGPDYIDPGHLATAAGRDACNLDVWMMGGGGVRDSFARNSASDISVIEGVMGFYDGFSGTDDLASTHQVARITGSPTVLVVDASGAARSVAATVMGFTRFERRSTIMAVILNRTGSRRHEALCRDAVESAGIPVLGAIPRDREMSLKSRHLGLVPAAEDRSVREAVLRSSRIVADHIDMEGLLRVARTALPIRRPAPPRRKGIRTSIGVALDGSFNFYYRDNLERLKNEGARLVFFSPESDAAPPDVDGLYIGGGFPEVRGAILEENRPMRDAIRGMIQDGIPAYAECGGLMYLSRSVRRRDGAPSSMAGILDADAVMTDRVVLNYTRGSMSAGPLVRGTSEFRGHEFHYSRMEGVASDSRFGQVLEIGSGIADGRDGLLAHGLMASYGHLYLGGQAAGNMVRRCAAYSRR